MCHSSLKGGVIRASARRLAASLLGTEGGGGDACFDQGCALPGGCAGCCGLSKACREPAGTGSSQGSSSSSSNTSTTSMPFLWAGCALALALALSRWAPVLAGGRPAAGALLKFAGGGQLGGRGPACDELAALHGKPLDSCSSWIATLTTSSGSITPGGGLSGGLGPPSFRPLWLSCACTAAGPAARAAPDCGTGTAPGG